MESYKLEIAKNLEDYIIGLDDTFSFKCRSCGACCRQRDDILLTAQDLFNIAVKLSLTTTQVIDKYCEVLIGHDTRMPIARLKPQGVRKDCPLLKGGRCLVHDSKPSVCALYPLGRVVLVNTRDPMDDTKPGQISDVKYILTKFTCGSLKKKQTVRSWLQRFNVPIDDIFFAKWNEFIVKYVECIKLIEKRPDATHKGMEKLLNRVFIKIYIDYNTQAEFMPQFETNTADVIRICKLLADYGNANS